MKISVERLKEIIKEEIANTSDVLEEDTLPILSRPAEHRRITYEQFIQPMISHFGTVDEALAKLAGNLSRELMAQGRWHMPIDEELKLMYLQGEAPEEPSPDEPIPGEDHPEEELPLEPEEELEPEPEELELEPESAEEEPWTEEESELEQ